MATYKRFVSLLACRTGTLLIFSSEQGKCERFMRGEELDACALEPRRRFVTECDKKRESRNFNPGLTALANNVIIANYISHLNVHENKDTFYQSVFGTASF